MKKLIFFLFFLTAIYTQAQNNVGIGTAAPHASALLDVSSTTKGLLVPRMTTAQRTAIVNPAKGLLVYDTEVNSLYHYNGAAWANLTASGGGGALSLPYSTSVDVNTNAFQITNAGNGAAITGVTTNEFGYAVSGISNSAYGYGIYGYANAPDAIAVYGSTGNGTAVKGYSLSGLGVDARSTNNTALKASIILGANANPVIQATHAGSGDAIEATSAARNGVKGSSNSSHPNYAGVQGVNTGGGYGVIGMSMAGPGGEGVRGATFSGTGVSGFSSSGGTALKGESLSGYGLQSIGKLKLSGGNTNPEAGAVLTSIDDAGNAVWKPKRIAFKAYGSYSSFIGVPISAASRKMHFASEQYDYGNNFTTTTSGSPSAAMSTFEAPTSGLYHFDVGIKLTLDDTFDDFSAVNVYVILKRNNADFTIYTLSTQCCNANLGYEVSLYGSIDQLLEPGDTIRIQIYQLNDDDATAKLSNNLETYFGGHLVFAH